MKAEPKRLKYNVLKRDVLSKPGELYRAFASAFSEDKKAYYIAVNGLGRAMRVYNQLIMYQKEDLRWVTEELMRRCPNDKFELFYSDELKKNYLEEYPDYEPKELFPGMTYQEAYEYMMERCKPYSLKKIFKYYYPDRLSLTHDDEKDDPDFRYPKRDIPASFFMRDQGRNLRLIITGSIPKEAWHNETEFEGYDFITLEESVKMANGKSLNTMVDQIEYYRMMFYPLRSVMYQARIITYDASQPTEETSRKYDQEVYDLYNSRKEYLDLFMLKKYWNQAMIYLMYAPDFIEADIKRVKSHTTTERGVYSVADFMEEVLRRSDTIDDMARLLSKGEDSKIYKIAHK